MKLQLTALALALIAAPAFAGDDARINNETRIKNDITVRGGAWVNGRIEIASESASVIDQDQATVGNRMVGDGDADASMGGNAASDAQGNIGINIAAGVGNAQSNDVALSALDGSKVFASAMSFNSQATTGNFGTNSGARNVDYNATVNGDALANARGNIGLNVAAGVGNAQSNSLAASVNTSAGGGGGDDERRGGGHDDHDKDPGLAAIAKATADSQQLTLLNVLDADCGDLDTTARLGGNALQGAQGNIGVNIAAGVGNAQHNGLSMAVAQGGN